MSAAASRACVVVIAVVSPAGGCDWSLHRMQERPGGDERDRPAAPAPALAVEWQPAVARAPSASPPAVTRALIDRGRDRYDRACAPCHGIQGDGDSDVAHAMAGTRPGSLVDAHARAWSDAAIANAIELGYGAMPSLADVLPARDRFAVVQFVRALQHRDVSLDELTASERAEAWRWLR